jgi:hypothetical protein
MGRDDRVRAGLGEQTRAGQMLGDAASSGSSSTSAGRAERAGAARPAPVRLSRPSQPTVVRRIGTGVAEPRNAIMPHCLCKRTGRSQGADEGVAAHGPAVVPHRSSSVAAQARGVFFRAAPISATSTKQLRRQHRHHAALLAVHRRNHLIRRAAVVRCCRQNCCPDRGREGPWQSRRRSLAAPATRARG